VDGYVIVWDAEERRQVARLQNPFALSLAWSIDGQALASGGGNQFVTVWDANSFSEIFKITQAETITGQTISGSRRGGLRARRCLGPTGENVYRL
jgi:WD40 repeat protein